MLTVANELDTPVLAWRVVHLDFQKWKNLISILNWVKTLLKSGQVYAVMGRIQHILSHLGRHTLSRRKSVVSNFCHPRNRILHSEHLNSSTCSFLLVTWKSQTLKKKRDLEPPAPFLGSFSCFQFLKHFMQQNLKHMCVCFSQNKSHTWSHKVENEILGRKWYSMLKS